jgi:hypothetical protein
LAAEQKRSFVSDLQKAPAEAEAKEVCGGDKEQKFVQIFEFLFELSLVSILAQAKSACKPFC